MRPKDETKSQQDQIVIEPLLAKLGVPSLNGTFTLEFSELIYKLKLPSIKQQDLIDISIDWKNPDFLDPDLPKPEY